MRRPRLDWWPLRSFVVQDTSMQPTLRPGDRLLASPWLPARFNDVVVLRDPEQQSIYLVKRLAEQRPGGLIVRADNPNVSRDSRHFGPVPRRLIVGRVFYRYLPAERRGGLGVPAVRLPSMELVLSLLALIVAIVALGLVLRSRKPIAEAPRADPTVHLETLRQALVDLRRDLDRVQGEVEELKAATEIVPAPPLPRARSVGLTDLREQLRAAHREPEPGSEE